MIIAMIRPKRTAAPTNGESMPTKASASDLTEIAQKVAVFATENAPDRVGALAALNMASIMLSILPEEGDQEWSEECLSRRASQFQGG